MKNVFLTAALDNDMMGVRVKILVEGIDGFIFNDAHVLFPVID